MSLALGQANPLFCKTLSILHHQFFFHKHSPAPYQLLPIKTHFVCDVSSSFPFPPTPNMFHFPPSSAEITCLAYIENPHFVSGTITDSYFYNITIRVYGFKNEHPFLWCSMHEKTAMHSKCVQPGIYNIIAKASLYLDIFRTQQDNANQITIRFLLAYIPHMHPLSPSCSHHMFSLIGDLKTVWFSYDPSF
jgi:hypothetical protein